MLHVRRALAEIESVKSAGVRNGTNCREICSALKGRRLDAALIPSVMLWPHAAALPVYRERLVAALPVEHLLSARSEGV